MSQSTVRVKDIVGSPWLALALRLALGSTLIAAGFGKLEHLALFVDTVAEYGILPDGLARFYGTALPWAELFVGCALVLGIFSAFAAAASIVMTASFFVGGVYSLFNPVGDMCSCFGDLISLSHSHALIVDAAMLFVAGYLLFRREKAEALGLGSVLRTDDLRMSGRDRFVSRLVLVAVATMLVVPFTGDTEAPFNPGDTGEPEFLVFWNECPECFETEWPILQELEQEYADRITFLWINYLEDPETAEEFGVENPLVMFLVTGRTDDGECVVHRRFEGTIDKDMVKSAFDEVLSGETT